MIKILVKKEDFFNFCFKNRSYIMGKLQGRIILVLFKKYYCFPPYIYFFGQVVLGKIIPGTVFPDPVIHF